MAISFSNFVLIESDWIYPRTGHNIMNSSVDD
ncbi:hypothetical protein BRLA_c041110 [Brevibacillus laterosporus LMG 15441]|uniref:Uncharacterized protein n=1 Tax=Brevibacillus laterosporus LMG 15441 TaxID=1042163 RepID=A0A075RAY4_BRELA|nr:hypothetical protein BRLA_c041110 [Brevibacillus laterosporus LMG 15441]